MTALSLRQVCSASSTLLTFLAFLREKLLTRGAAVIAKKKLQKIPSQMNIHVRLPLMAPFILFRLIV